MKLLNVIRYNIILYYRTSYYKKKNIKFLFVLIPVYVFLLYQSFSVKNIFVSLVSSLFIIGGISFQGIKEGSFIRTAYLFPLILNKNKSFCYGILSEILMKMIIVIPFCFKKINLSIYLFILNILFIIIIYLLSELSMINKVFLKIYNLITSLPIGFFAFLGIYKLDSINQSSIIFSYLNDNMFYILNMLLIIKLVLS